MRYRPRGANAARACAMACALLLLAGCATEGLAFVRDDRVTIDEPDDNQTVRLPFVVRWTASDYDGRFVVFFDRSPMRPNQSLRSLVPEDDPCRTEPDCPDEQWLEDRNIYVTNASPLRVERLPDERDNDRAKDRHELTIILLDETGRRSGESAFVREFIVEREDG